MIDIPAGESERARELRKYRILGTAPDDRFDRLAALARDLLNMPIVLISLLDDEHQWFKANIGFPATRIRYQEAFCAHTILSGDVLVVTDTLNDARFANNSLVKNAPNIRFYAGAPIVIRPNIRLGTICVMDRHPRSYSDKDKALLKTLAEITVDQLQLHRSELELKGEAERGHRKDDELTRQQSDLWKQNRLLAHSSHMAHIGVWEYQVPARKLLWSDEVYRIHEVPQDFKPELETALSFYPGDIRHRVRRAVEEAIETGTMFEFELPLVTAKGNEKWVRVMGEVQREGDQVMRVFGSVQDVTERVNAQRKIDFLSHRDALTKLANRAAFREKLDKIATSSMQSESPFALLFIDLDHFKEVNDTLGHHVGDALMREIADRIVAVCKQSDIIARTGGDEFAIIRSYIDSRDDVAEFAEHLQQKLTQVFYFEGRPLSISAGIGIAISPKDGTEPSTLLRCADLALQAAKKQGRKHTVFFDHAMRVELERLRYTLTSVRAAMDRGDLVPYYQPIFSLQNGALIAFEALIRWIKAKGLIAAPGAFAAALDDPDLSDLIGTYMIQKVAQQVAAWNNDGLHGFRVGINIAAGQLRGGRLAATILEELGAYGIDPQRLAVEITETALLSYHAREVANILRELHDNGVRIALDDFGTGYASLSHLRDFPVDVVKIDKSFVQNMLTSTESANIVTSIINLSHSLGKRTIAEGIETIEVAIRLRKLGCDLGQGYLLGRAMSADQVKAMLAHPKITTPSQPATGQDITEIRSVSRR